MTRRARRLRTGVVLGVALALVGVAGWVVWQGRTPVVVRERCTAEAGGTSAELAPDQAANAATIAGIAVQRGLPARAATIAIATAIQESKLRNLDYGDRDSLGLFQQRPSQGWGTPEQVQDPVYAANAFYDVLAQIEGFEELEITDASDRVQRSAFPDAVADHEDEGRAWASALAGYSPGAISCRLRAVEGGGSTEAGAVAEALGAELLGAAPPVEGAGVVVDLGDRAEPERMAWASAHWAVASAEAYDVVEVAVADRVWDRSATSGAWEAAEEPLPAGAVRITLA